jgi:hypothetical protein
MPDDVHELFWRRHGATMRELGYRPPAAVALRWRARHWLRSLSGRAG